MEIKRGNSTYSGVIESNGKIVCEQCKNENAKCESTMHMDSTKWYSWTYECECGNAIVVKTDRDEEDMMWWGED
jgi:late competence protein required for DNA uptake (superfamily II DNA/RNA helicase)